MSARAGASGSRVPALMRALRIQRLVPEVLLVGIGLFLVAFSGEVVLRTLRYEVPPFLSGQRTLSIPCSAGQASGSSATFRRHDPAPW